ncbi:MAG TPA: hypothetical protein ENK05_09665 [Gammaproteobacteria bacterium]|nr:hypothetical protein [Gammaproteobacteria bacterium]
MHKRLAKLLAVGLFGASGLAQANIVDDARTIVSASPFTTPELLAWTVEGIPSCINWCVTGISFRLVVDGFPPKISIETTPHIAHNSPDLLVMTHPDVGKGPWTEWATIVGPAQKAVITPLMRLMSGGFGAVPGGGQSRTTHFGETQSTTFKEAQVIGHPMALIPLILSGQGIPSSLIPTLYPPGESEATGADPCSADEILGSSSDCSSPLDNLSPDVLAQRAITGVQDWLTDWPNNAKTVVGFIRPEFLQVFSVIDTIKTIRGYISTFKSLRTIITSGGVGFGVSLGAERVLCPTDIMPFVPYYLSAVDAFFWRNGFPITDLTKAASIINPLSGDRIGEGLDIWGYTFPRHGFVENNNDQHVAAVIATRASHIVGEFSLIQNQHLRWPLPDRQEGAWQAIYPTPETTCTVNLEEGDTANNAAYAWNRWRQYDCDMSEEGSLITTVDFSSPICLAL